VTNLFLFVLILFTGLVIYAVIYDTRLNRSRYEQYYWFLFITKCRQGNGVRQAWLPRCQISIALGINQLKKADRFWSAPCPKIRRLS